MSSEIVFRPRYVGRGRPHRARWVAVCGLAAAAVLGTAGAVMADAMTPAAHVRPAAVHVATVARHVGAPAGQAAPRPAISKLPKVHVLRSLFVVHGLVRVHRLIWRPWWMRRRRY